ncbi:MAG: patatin-like phospholipase family protein [Neomegalonema sp.]|nr:patatin-like phospholipase family protein [Neomegalonema sp.]
MSQHFENTPSAQRLFASGKKRILALDGGGLRGMISIAFLERMEQVLREETGKPDYVLSDFFDLIGGTSVGSLLGTMLALGYPVADVRRRFEEWGPAIFKGRDTVIGQDRFDARQLVNRVRSVVEDETLGSEKLLTGLVIVAKRADTGSPWIMNNNPRMKYFDDGADENFAWRGNRHYKLVSLLRASTAAPFLFTPVEIEIATDDADANEVGEFVDGGVSPHNNPALQMLMMAGLPAYQLNWSLSPEDLLLISVGTGTNRTRVKRTKSRSFARRMFSGFASVFNSHIASDLEEAQYAAATLRGLVTDGQTFGLTMLQSLSEPRFSWRINSEIGDLSGQLLAAPHPRGLMRFQRYDAPLELGLVPPEFDIAATKAEREAMFPIDEPKNIPKLYAMGQEAAAKQVSAADFAGFVDR